MAETTEPRKVQKGEVVDGALVPWIQPPGHYGAFSKLLVGAPQGSRQLDFRLSVYPPRGCTDEHAHEEVEQIFYVIAGDALFRLDGTDFHLGPGKAVFVPPGTHHSIMCNGTQNLEFIVVTSPPGELVTEDTFLP